MTKEIKDVLSGWVAGCLFMLARGYLVWPTASSSKVYANGSAEVVMVRGDRWGIITGKEDEILDMLGLYGLTDCKQKRIILRGSLTPANQRDTVLHELLHAGTCDEAGQTHNKFYNSETEAGHEGFYKFSNYMSTLLYQNPELATYFKGETK